MRTMAFVLATVAIRSVSFVGMQRVMLMMSPAPVVVSVIVIVAMLVPAP